MKYWSPITFIFVGLLLSIIAMMVYGVINS